MISTQLSTITESVQLSPPQASSSPISPTVSDSSVLDAAVPCLGAILYTTLPQTGIVNYEQPPPTSIDTLSDVTPTLKYEYATIISPPHPQHLGTPSFSQSSSPPSSPSTFNSAHSCSSAITSPTSHQNQLYRHHQGHRSELPHQQYSAQEPHFSFPPSREQFYQRDATDITNFDNHLHAHSDSAQYPFHAELVSVFEDQFTFITDNISDANNNSSSRSSSNNNSPCFTEPSPDCDYAFDTSRVRFTGGRISPLNSEQNRGELPPVSSLLPFSAGKSRALQLTTMMKSHESVYDESDDSGVSSLEEESHYTNLTNVPQPANENGLCYGYDAQESNFGDWSMSDNTILKTELNDIFNIGQDILFQDDCDPFDIDTSAQESDEYDSGSTDGVHFSQCFSFPNADGYRPVIAMQSIHPYSEQESVVSSDGESIEKMLPHFSELQNPTEPEKASHYVRNTLLSPKKKRKIVRESPSYVEKERRKPGRKPGQVSNVLHLWEFMRDLLHSSQNQGIIEWISKADGVFKVINSTEVARLWGEKKKNKKKMTYEKLSRSLRYSRLEGYFADLPRDKNYPKKLCFKFGPKSKDWH